MPAYATAVKTFSLLYAAVVTYIANDYIPKTLDSQTMLGVLNVSSALFRKSNGCRTKTLDSLERRLSFRNVS